MRSTILDHFKRLTEIEAKWKQCCGEGSGHLTNISNTLLKLTYTQSKEWGPLSEEAALHQQVNRKLYHSARIRQEKSLSEVLHRMGDLVGEISELSNSVHELVQQNANEKGTTAVFEKPVLHTTTAYSLALLFSEILSMYQKELVAKSLIVQDIFYCTSRDTSTLYLASWQMQPFIDTHRIEEIRELFQIEQAIEMR